MSKIRRTSLMVPSAKVFVKSALDSIGNNTFSTVRKPRYSFDDILL